MPVIEVQNLTKEYRLGALQGLKQSILNAGARLIGKPLPGRPLFKALDDVNFSIEQGEVIGIIGHNGAGKSTLLKMLARITTPTHGSVKVNGRIAPLIEVGAGFVPDFTGRENVYLNGAILGMSKREIDSKFEEIVDFAEMKDFIDTPVKRYSSGMQVKLAFAVATSIESEILIVDEVLAVGDLAFQRKCFDRMEELTKRQGRTVLLVSHNIRQIERMCSRCILLDHGQVSLDDTASTVCNQYYKESNARANRYTLEAKKGIAKIHNNTDEFNLLSIDILDNNNNPTSEIISGNELKVRVRFELTRKIKRPEIVVGTHTTDFFYLTAASTIEFDDRPDFAEGIHEIEYRVASFPLTEGTYCIRLIFFDEFARPIFQGETLKTFSVIQVTGEKRESNWMTLRLPTTWVIDKRTFENE